MGQRRHQSDTSARGSVGRLATRQHPDSRDGGNHRCPAGDADDPIVFAAASDPVIRGIVERLDRPSGNVTGFAAWALGGKWLELLSEIAPGLKRAAIMFNPDIAFGPLIPSFEAAARSLKVVPNTAPVHNDAEIETAIIALGREAGGGLVVLSDLFTYAHRAPIIMAAARKNVPAVYYQSCSALGPRLRWASPVACSIPTRSEERA